MKTLYSQDELLRHIIGHTKGLIFLDGPTRSGKSLLVNSIKEFSFGTFIMTGEQFYDFIIESAMDLQSKFNPLNNIRTHRYICIEDLDFYGGRPHTECEFANVLTILSKNSVVVITGIHLKKKMQSMLDNVLSYEYFEKINNNWKIYIREEN